MEPKSYETSPLILVNSTPTSYNSAKRNKIPTTPTEVTWIENVGESEWQELEAISGSRGEVLAPDETRSFSWRTLWAYAGPGWLMSIAYIDPGNLESDLQAGAYAGYSLIWVLFLSTIVGFFLQVLAARLGVVTGKNLAEMCYLEFPRWASLILWVMAEIAIVGSDIQEVLGSAIAFQILFGLPLWAGCMITAADTFTFLVLHKFGIRKLEAFFVVLIATMLGCFLVIFVQGSDDYVSVVEGLIPSIQPYATTQAVGILGAVIMPHNIFLHSALVQSRVVDRTNHRKVAEANKYFSIEAACALLVSFIINLAVLGVFAKGFFSVDCESTFATYGLNTACIQGNRNITSYGSCTLDNGKTGICQEIGLSYAGDALKQMLGGYAQTIWAIGLLAAGQSSTMTGTYAGQFVMEGFLQLSLAPWKRVALTRSVALIPALAVAMISEQYQGACDHLDELLNVLQSIQLPFALLPVLHFTSSSKLMGNFVNGLVMQVMGWLLGLLVCVINLYLVITKVTADSHSFLLYFCLFCIAIAYFSFLLYLAKDDGTKFFNWLRNRTLMTR